MYLAFNKKFILDALGKVMHECFLIKYLALLLIEHLLFLAAIIRR